MQIKTHRHLLDLHERPPTYQRIIPQNTQTKTQQADKAKTRTQQQTKANTGAKEIQQANPGGPNKQPKHQAPPSHQQTSPQVGTITEPEARPTSVQLKRKASCQPRLGRPPSMQSAAIH